MLEFLNNKNINSFLKTNFIGVSTLIFSVIFIWWTTSNYLNYKKHDKKLEFFVQAIGTLNSLEEELINTSQLIENDKPIDQEKSFNDVNRQNKNAIKYLLENIGKIPELRHNLGNHYAFLMFLDRDYQNFKNSPSNALPAYKKRFINTLFIVIKSNKRLVKELRSQMAVISLELQKTWQSLFIMILGSCLIAIGLSIITFLFTNQIEYRKQVELQLLEKDHRLELIYEQIPTIFYTCDTNLVYTAAKGEELLKYGIDTNRLINKVSVYKLFKGYENEEFTINAHQRALKGETVKYEHKFKDRYYDISIKPLKDKDKIVGVIGIAIDITERKNTELLLEMKNRELDSFVYKASHDMRGSLSNIISAAELIKFEPQQTNQLAEIIKEKANYLAMLLNDMLELTKISKNELNYFEIDIEPLLKEVISNINEEWKANVNFNITNKLKVPFYSDKKLLRSIFLNLIGNAAKYKKLNSAIQHEVDVSIEGNLHRVLFKIKDNGVGISKNETDKVFNMFYRVNHDNEGSGLGLFIVESAVKRLNGSINLESELNIGTRVTVILPNMSPGNIHET